MVIEFARNELCITDAEHAEYNPGSTKLVINPLSCSLAGQTLEIEITNKFSKTFKIFGSEKINEKYHCKFGLNPAYENQFNDEGFKVVGIDKSNESRIFELENHPFFIATLCSPGQFNKEKPHKLVTEFLKAVIKST